MNIQDQLLLLGTRVTFTEDDCKRGVSLLAGLDSLDDLFPRLKKLKTLHVFYTYLARMRPFAEGAELEKIDRLLAELTEKQRDSESVQAKKERIRQSLHELNELALELGLPIPLVKGSSIPVLLSGYDVREQNDIDVVLRNIDDLWRLIAAMLVRGYEIDDSENPWLQAFWFGGEKVLGGHVTLKGERGIGIDLHTHSMSYGQAEMLDIPIWERAQKAELFPGAESQLYAPSPEDALLFLLAHSYNHGYFTMKDLNDLYMLITQAELDWAYVVEQAEANVIRKGIADALLLLDKHFGFDAQSLFEAHGIPREVQGFGLHGLDEIDPYLVYHHELDIAKHKNDIESGIDMLNKRVAMEKAVAVLMNEDDEEGQDRLCEAWERPHLEGDLLGTQVLLFSFRDAVLEDVAALRRFPDGEWLAAHVPDARRLSACMHARTVDDKSELVITPAGFYTTTRTMIFTETGIEKLNRAADELLSLLAGRTAR